MKDVEGEKDVECNGKECGGEGRRMWRGGVKDVEGKGEGWRGER